MYLYNHGTFCRYNQLSGIFGTADGTSGHPFHRVYLKKIDDGAEGTQGMNGSFKGIRGNFTFADSILSNFNRYLFPVQGSHFGAIQLSNEQVKSIGTQVYNSDSFSDIGDQYIS